MTITGLIAFLGLIVGFGFLIFVHELGHFLVAKWAGIKCTQFAIGFGHSIATWRKGIGFRVGSTEPEYERRVREHLKAQGIDPDKLTDHEGSGALIHTGGPTIDKATAELGLGETEYRFNWIPLGGYVKMLGQEDMDPTARSADPRAFNSKSVGARSLVISAGVVMNVIVGVGFFIVAFMSGVAFPPAIVGDVVPDMPAARAYAQGHDGEPQYRGLQMGDRVTHINDREISDWPQLQMATALGARGASLDLTIKRPGYDRPLHYRLTPEPGEQENLMSIGVMPPRSLTLAEPLPGSLPARAGLDEDWQLVAIDGQPIESYHQYHRAVTDTVGRPVELTFVDPDNARELTLNTAAQPRFVHGSDGRLHLAGLAPATHILHVGRRTPAERAGVEVGDVIARLQDVSWPTAELVRPTVLAAGGEPVTMSVLRDGKRIALKPMRPRRTIWAQLAGEGGQIGVLAVPAEAPIVARTLSDTPAAALDLPAGSRIVELADEPVASWADVQRVLGSLEAPEPGEALEVQIVYELNIAGQPREQDTLTLDRAELERIAAAGWSPPTTLSFKILEVPVRADNPWQATVLGVEKTHEFLVRTYQTLLRLIQGTVQMRHLRGPVGIVDVGTQVAQERGWQYVMFFLGLISVNLAVINFLPIPIVDGGHMVFLILEKIKGSPVSVQVQAAATYVGLALIAFVFITVLFYDVARLMGG